MVKRTEEVFFRFLVPPFFRFLVPPFFRFLVPPFFRFLVPPSLKGGYTLIEIMIVTSIIGITLAFITPNLFGIIRRQKLEGNIQGLAFAIKKARADAMERGTRTVIFVAGTPTGTSVDFDNDGRREHYLAFVDNDRDTQYDNGEPVLYREDWGNVVISTNTLGTNTSGTPFILLFPQGTVGRLTEGQRVNIKFPDHESEYSLEVTSLIGLTRVRRLHL